MGNQFQVLLNTFTFSGASLASGLRQCAGILTHARGKCAHLFLIFSPRCWEPFQTGTMFAWINVADAKWTPRHCSSRCLWQADACVCTQLQTQICRGLKMEPEPQNTPSRLKTRIFSDQTLQIKLHKCSWSDQSLEERLNMTTRQQKELQ